VLCRPQREVTKTVRDKGKPSKRVAGNRGKKIKMSRGCKGVSPSGEGNGEKGENIVSRGRTERNPSGKKG